MEISQVKSLLINIMSEEQIFINESMSKHTTFKVGGNADILVIPKDTQQIIDVIRICYDNDIPLLTIGNGSNIIVRDKGIKGVVMKIFNQYADIKVTDTIITSQSGALLSKVANIALKNSLAGFEFAGGIPGTVGGAVIMNAGAYDREIKDVVIETTYVDCKGKVGILKGEEHQFGYRKSWFEGKKYIILECKVQLQKGNYQEIKEKMDNLNSRRKQKQPIEYPSAGSVFKRPQGYFTGKLIQDCGLKGYRIGGAQVSELHAGFIINNKNATSKDVIDLITYIKDKVKENFGVELETEVKIVGEE